MNDVIKGTSGATIHVVNDIAAKTAPEGPARDRLHEQEAFMRRIGRAAFPKIIAHTPAGYIMERLDPLNWTAERSGGGVFQEATDVLSAYVWGSTRRVRFADVCGLAHLAYVKERVDEFTPHLAQWFGAAYDALRNIVVTASDDIHGDPTAENMMQRDRDLVLIDPIPATKHMPALVSVDLGKMLQSADGYERVKTPNFPLKAGTSHAVLDGWDWADRRAAHYFHAVHVLRLIPYQPEARQRVFIERLSEAAGVHA